MDDSGHPDGISHASEGEETHGCQNEGAAKLDADVRSHLQRHCLIIPGDYQSHHKCVNMKKWSISGVSVVLAADMLYCFSYKELKHKWLNGIPKEDPAGRVHFAFPP